MNNIPTTASEYWKLYKEKSKIEGCFASSILGCTNKISHAHSIQKNGILSQLEDYRRGGMKIYSMDDWITRDPEELISDFKLVGKKKASIFSGFCDKHDIELFAPIEQEPINLTEKQMFLFYYRGFAHNYHHNAELCKFDKFMLDNLVGNGTDALEYLRDLDLEYKILSELLSCGKEVRRRLNVMLYNNDFSMMDHFYQFIEYKRIASSQLITAPFTHSNINLKRNESFSQVMLTVIPDKANQRTVLLLSWFKDDIKGIKFVSELKELEKHDFTQAVSSILMYSGGNTYFAPSLWESFSQEEQRTCIEELNYIIHDVQSRLSFFNSKINFFR